MKCMGQLEYCHCFNIYLPHHEMYVSIPILEPVGRTLLNPDRFCSNFYPVNPKYSNKKSIIFKMLLYQ